MADFPEGFDLEALLAPVADETPAGVDLREDHSPNAIYYRLRDARSEARAVERRLDAPEEGQDPPDPRPHWRTIHALSQEALTQSKDLEIAAWLTEALLRSENFESASAGATQLAGFAAGTRLMTGLIEGFWDNLYPTPDEDGIATRVAPITGLNGEGRDGTLLQPLRKIILFERPGPDAKPLYFFEHSQIPFDTLLAEARQRTDVLRALRPQAQAAADAWKRLVATVDPRAGADTPPTSQVAALLDEIRDLVVKLAGDAGVPADADQAQSEAAPGAGGTPAAAGAVPSAAILASREEALRSLAQIAEFFRRTEPVSPLAYTLQEAVRRARLTWPELLAEIVADTGSRDAILTSLGIRPPPPPSE